MEFLGAESPPDLKVEQSVRQDTIVAIATPPGEGGIGIVRLSGAEAVTIASRLFRGKLADRRVAFGHVCDPTSGQIVDEALGIMLCGPRTYTREDTVELQAHGGPAPLGRIVELCLREGARLAEPGEFTLRAFLNGRLDLAQAEAVLDVIRARTDASLRLAVQGLGGRLSTRLRDLRTQLLNLLAYLSARADFPDEDVPPQDIAPDLIDLEQELARLIATADYGLVYRQGVRVAIVGRPNVGKSSLLNRLLREDRAIVTSTAGTTRDTLEETANLSGVPVILTDTAGLGDTEDAVERMGITRTRDAIARSDALLVVLEAGRPPEQDEAALLEETAGQPRIVAVNKCDLALPEATLPGGIDAVFVSALAGFGLAELERRLADLVTGGRTIAADAAVVTNPRHKAALERAQAHLREAIAGLEAALPEDVISMDLRGAAEALGEITGDSITEDLLDSIFRNFCIGK